jgi:hypothetical protein
LIACVHSKIVAKSHVSEGKMVSTRKLSLAVIVCWCSVAQAKAAENTSVPLLLMDDVRAAAGAAYQGVTGDASGAIHYPDEILAYPVAETTENKSLLDAWKASHRFFVIPLELSIAPAPGRIPERVDVSLAFSGLGSMGRQPLIVDVFPQTGFSPGAVSAKGELKLGADLKFQQGIADATAGGNVALAFSYAPSFASVVSGFGSGTAFWQLVKTQDKQPLGGLPLKLVVACPIANLKDLILTTDVRIQYAGPWWTTGLSVASFRSKISLPPASKAAQ